LSYQQLLTYSIHNYAKELLLGTQDTSWSAESDPTNEIRGSELVMLHSITSNETSSSSKTSLGH
jgi:hypothetical protein